jgi:hypothetical protein
MATTDAQRAAVAGRTCIVCGSERRIDPAHLIPRSLGGCDDPLCVVPACRRCHRAYDRGELDLLAYLEPAGGRSSRMPSATWGWWEHCDGSAAVGSHPVRTGGDADAEFGGLERR